MFTLISIVGDIFNYFNPMAKNEKKFWDWLSRDKPRVVPKIINTGSQIYILKQDPSVKVVGVRMKWLRDEIQIGPKTDDIVISGLSRTIYPTDTHNNFLYHPNSHEEEFEALNVLGIVCNVLRMYKKTLKELNQLDQFSWPWGRGPLQVYPSTGVRRNAYYSRQERALKFFHFRGDDGRMVHIARSFDIVAHEMGHAVLDAIRPMWNLSDNPYTNALHESIGDLTAIFAIMDDLDMCDSVVSHCKGDLHHHFYFPIIGEEFGTAIGLEFGLRNADTNKTILDVSSEMHDLSRVFTSAMYDILADLYDAELEKNDYEEPAIVLHMVGKNLFHIFIKALTRSPIEDATYYDMAQLMLSAENDTSKWLIMNKYFQERQMLNVRASSLHTVETFRATLENHVRGECPALCGFHLRHLHQ